MSVKVSESGYRTLKLYLLSCQSTVGEEVLKTYFNYSGNFPVTFEELLGDFSWTIDKLPNNVFKALINYAEGEGEEILTPEMICLYFAGKEHLLTAKNSCLVYRDLTTEEKIVGHLTLPVKITEDYCKRLSGKVVYNDMVVKNIFDESGDAKVGDIVLIHFASVVMVRPSDRLVDQIIDLQKDFVQENMQKISGLTYSSTYDDTLKRLNKYILSNHN